MALLHTTGISADNFEVTTTEQLKVWAEFPEKIIADDKTVNYVKVFEHDDDGTKFCAFNMEFILPEGFRVNKVKQGRETVDDIFLSNRGTSKHSISCSILNRVDLRIISTSQENSEYFEDDVNGNPIDELFTIGLIAEPTLPPGEYQVTMEGVKFCQKNADARIPATLPVYTIKVTRPNPTNITTIETSPLDPDDCYGQSGIKVDPTKIHDTIVINKTRKIFVK